MTKRSFSGGIHPPSSKNATKNSAIITCPLPSTVVIPVSQHIGAPSKPIVEVGAAVKTGDLLTEPGGFISVPVHASISGTVKAIEPRPHPLGNDVLSIVIESDEKDEWNSSIGPQKDYLQLDKQEKIRRIRDAGIAGMGGATFPTHVKLSPPGDKPIDTFLLNGAECEPYLTSDHRLMLEQPKKIILGMQIIVSILGAQNAGIGVENNKPDAIKVLRKTIADLGLPYKVYSLPVKYPQGAEKQLIVAVTKRAVPAGGLPMDVGCVVQNVGTAMAVYEAVAEKKPLVERVVTVTGKGVKNPQNVLARIGTPYSALLEFCGGLEDNVGKIIMGGPMMGLAQASLEIPVIKGTSGLLILDEKFSKKPQEITCISCARCVDVCPMKLVPTILAKKVKYNIFDSLEKDNVLDCIECGSCAYVCPSQINLVHYIKYGKHQVMKARKKAG
ncbi:electron transport complex subunit RsxC [candidate division KSB1 bacterium]|nr:electron transport complex subunit RsxC [candidate division KSB1 bacterium]